MEMVKTQHQKGETTHAYQVRGTDENCRNNRKSK
jgi:hypothetical protein